MRLEKTFKFRDLWVGIAMLWIIFFHSGFQIESFVLRHLQGFGYGGVDICLFASGVGCYYSLDRDPDILAFQKRRIKRLGPVYFCFIVPWLFWRYSLSELPAQAILGNLLGIQTLVSWQYHFNWYIGGLVVYYLCLPYLKRITDSCSKFWQDALVGVFLTAVSIPFWDEGKNAVMILSRLPVLYAGVVCAKKAKQGYVLTKKAFWVQMLVAVFGAASLVCFSKYMPDHLWTRGLYWYPFALIVPGSCILLSALAEWIEQKPFLRWINSLLRTVGSCSFEVYLIHVFLYERIMPEIVERVHGVPDDLLWLLTLPVVAGGSFLLNRVSAAFSRMLEKCWNKAKA